MAQVSSVDRAPTDTNGSRITIRRDGEPDLQIERGYLLLTVETTPRGSSPSLSNKRWKVYRLYGTRRVWDPVMGDFDRLVVAEEGHSSMKGEKVRYTAHVCSDAVEAWTAMGKLDELKEPFAELGLPVVQKI